jgi:hypothetical protein
MDTTQHPIQLLMSQETHGVHRCPSCEQLSEAEYGVGGKITCLGCGHVTERSVPAARRRQSYGMDVGGGSLVQRNVAARRNAPEVALLQKTVLPVVPASVEVLDSDLDSEVSYQRHQDVVSEDGDKKIVRRRKRKRKFRFGRVLLVGAWFGSIILILALVKKQMKDATIVTPKGPQVPVEDQKIEEQRRAEAEGYTKKSLPECYNSFVAFSAAPDAATRAQFVRSGAELAPQMASFYNQNTTFRPKAPLFADKTNLVLRNEMRAIESVWRNEAGETKEIVFIREEGKWKVDWEFFVRYSSSPWHLFLSEVGPSEGVFRAYFRVKESVYSDDGNQVFNLRFYPATNETLVRNRASSPAVIVPFESESGSRIRKVVGFKDRKPLAGERNLFMADPANLHRVRVALEWREGADGERYLHLNEVLAGNWLGEGFEESFTLDEGGEELRVGTEVE